MINEMIDSIYRLFINELDFIQEHSYFASQSMKNQDECGELVELAIRKFLREVIGDRFKVTHGYIYSSEKRQLSPQIDIIITDRLVPHKLKRFEYLDNLEIVPVESVVAIFEVKRTLNPSALKKAKEHLEKVFETASLSKTNEKIYFHGGFTIAPGENIQLSRGLLSNPLIGIIGLLHEGKDGAIEKDKIFSELPWFLDTIFSFRSSLDGSKGAFIAPMDPTGDGVNTTRTFALQKRFYEGKVSYVAFYHDRIKLLQNFTAYLIAYLNGVSGRIFNVNDYFNLNEAN